MRYFTLPEGVAVGRRQTRRLTAAQFAAAMCLISRMSEARRAAARSALVDGRTAQSVATEYGWGRTAVHNAASVVWRMYERYQQAKRVEKTAMRRAGAL